MFLGKGDKDDINLNKGLMENAIRLFVELVSKIDVCRWSNIHSILSLQSPPEKDWLDKEWYNDLLKKLIDDIITEKVLMTENGNFISPNSGLIPSSEDLEKGKVETLWNICCNFSNYKDNLPAKSLAIDWAKIISGWKSLKPDIGVKEVTAEKIAGEIAQCGNLGKLTVKLVPGQDAFNVLNEFYEFLLSDDKKQWIFNSYNILLDQNVIFRNKKDLFKDEGIDESLKDIDKELGEDIRNSLLHPKISNIVKNTLHSKSQNEVLSQVVTKIKKNSNPTDVRSVQANIDLFDWLLRNNEFGYFDGYPVLTRKEQIFYNLNKDRILAPKEIWNEKAGIYFDLFPQDSIIASQYYEKNAQKDKWAELEKRGLILTDPLYIENEKINRENLEHFAIAGEKIDEEKSHDIIAAIEFSKIVFLETSDKGIMDTVRGSKEKTRKFLNFVFDYVIEQDKRWEDNLEVRCECNSTHKIHPAQWVSVLKRRQWIPAPKDKPLTSLNLSMVIGDQDELLRKCRQNKPSRLLNILNISISELMMHIAAKNDTVKLELDKAMGSLFSTFMTNPEQLNKIAKLAESNTDTFVKEIEERLQIKEQIDKNQIRGSLVENVLKNVLESQGFKVDRTGVGSDFVIENDFITDNMENVLDVKKADQTSFLIEIKSTTQDYVRMTITQGKEARDKPDKYILCVISLVGEEIDENIVRNNVKFVSDIGQRIKDKVTTAENHEQEQEALGATGDIEIEINEDPIRFKINKSVWSNGKTLGQFSEFIRTL